MTAASLSQNESNLGSARLARWVAAVRLWLVSERGPVHVVAIVWVVGVLAPVVISVFFSLLKERGLRIEWDLSLHAFRDIIESGRWEVVIRTLTAAAPVTAICMVIGFPFALWLAERARSEKLIQFVWMALTVPFVLDPSVRTLLWRGVLGWTGLINEGLMRLHLIDSPIEWLLFSDFSIYLGVVRPYFPNMVMPIYLAILLIDNYLIQASADLGATPAATLHNIVIPLAMPGIVAGIIFTFVPVMGDSIVPSGRRHRGHVRLPTVVDRTTAQHLRRWPYTDADAVHLGRDHVSLTVEAGEFLTILGPSGSGRTTLLRIVGGFETLAAAERLNIAGVDVRGLPANHREAATVFQHYALFPHVTVGQNVEYGLKVRGVMPAGRRVQAEAALRPVRRSDEYDRRIHQLSGGEKQRVAFARALGQPAFLALHSQRVAIDPVGEGWNRLDGTALNTAYKGAHTDITVRTTLGVMTTSAAETCVAGATRISLGWLAQDCAVGPMEPSL